MSSLDKSLALPPGTTVFVGEKKVESSRIDVIRYNVEKFDEVRIDNVDEMPIEFPDDMVTWINLFGLHDVKNIEKLCGIVGVDPLLVEDIANTIRRPKIEEMDDYYFFVLKDMIYHAETSEIGLEHISLVVGKNYIITFQETDNDNFDIIRDRIRQSKGKLRTSKVDYLFNRLMDAIVDNYFVVIQQLGDLIDDLEDTVVLHPSRELLQVIHQLKQQIVIIRRVCNPTREIISTVLKLEGIVISHSTQVFARSIADHLYQIIDSLEIYRDMLTGFLDIYLSSLSNKTNDIMKVLTIVTSIFIPLSFLAGIYGMNFDNMPEYHYKYAYPLLWVVMILISVVMLWFFKRMKWLETS